MSRGPRGIPLFTVTHEAAGQMWTIYGNPGNREHLMANHRLKYPDAIIEPIEGGRLEETSPMKGSP